MAIKGLQSKQLANNPSTPAPKFNFREYSTDATFVNNSENIDFVTYDGSLYVCTSSTPIQPTHTDPIENGGFLLVVAKGEDGKQGKQGKDGADGKIPQIGARFNGGQLEIFDSTGTRLTTSPDLTGKVWKPVQEGSTLSWELSKSNSVPSDIDLEQLRPVEEKPLLLRVDSDNTKRSDEESGPANMIQWKHEGDEHWTNLISISELMNLALCGICFWYDNNDQEWHFGNKEVLKATYQSDKNGRKIVSRVELGDVLFDAGSIPINDYGVDIELINQRLDALENATPEVDAYTKAESDARFQPKGNYLTEHQSLAGLVKGVRVNNGGVNGPDGQGIVDITVGNGGQPVDTSDCVKSVTINGTTKTPVNGNVSFTISVGETSLFDVKIEDNHLWKTTDGQTWEDLGAVNTGTGGSGMSESDVKHLIGQILEGVLDSAIPEYVKGADHDYFIRKSGLVNYTTIDQVRAMIRDAMTDQNVDYYRVFTLYQRTNSPSNAPAKPVAGVWEWNTAAEVDNITLKPNASSNWTNHPENATSNAQYLWMTSATYSYLTKSEVGDWENPVCLTGENGREGKDGKGIEFIYHLGAVAPSIDYTKSKKDSTTNNRTKTWWATEASEDSCPGDGNNGYWTDDPVGIDDLNENTKIEWASIRKSHYDSVNKVTVWEDFCSPFIWAKWGEDGVDGAGVEYIFHVDASDTLSNNLIPAQTLEEIYYITNGQIDYSRPKPGYENYDSSDWVPDGNSGRPDQNWSDNPSDVDEQQPYEWVSIRKYNGQTGHWGPFSAPKVWGLWGQKTIIQQEVVSGTTVYKPYNCYAFTRTNVDISGYRVTGGQAYDDPLDGIVTKNGNTIVQMTWFDGIPNGTEQLWSIQALIGDESQSSDAAWSSPARVGDRPGFQVEFAPSNNNTDAVYNKTKTLPSLNNYLADTPEGVDEVAWRTAASNANCGSWNDESNENTVYMAESRIVAGSWTAWNVIKIKGEKGEPGEGIPGTPGSDGTDIEFVYFRTDNEEHRPGMSPTAGTYDGQHKVSEDPYEDDFLPMATASGFTLADNELKIGNDFFWHDHPAGVDEQLSCEWVATRHTYYQNGQKLWSAFNIALWSKFGANGRDGDGIEYVFWGLSEQDVQDLDSTWPTQRASNARNNGDNVNPTRTDNSNRSITSSEYLPALLINNVERQAVDDNPGIENYQYVFASMRKYDGGSKSWGEFSEIKLWNEQNTATLESVILDITDDTHPVYVDEDGRILDRYMNYCGYSTDGMYLYKNLVLLNNGDVSIVGDNGDVRIAELIPNSQQSNCYNKEAIASPGIPVTSNGITAHVYPYWVCKHETCNYSSVQLRVIFDQVSGQNPILDNSFDITIKVESADGTCVGSDTLRLVPRYSDKEVELSHVPRTQRTTEEGGTTYSDSQFNFYGWYGSNYTPLSLIKQTHFYFKYDDQATWTEFYIPSNNSDLADLENNVDGIQSGEDHFYFDRSGTILQNNTGAFFEIWLYNSDYNDNVHGEWTNWSAQAYVKAATFTATNDYPIDELYFGIGFGGNGPIDEANVHIIYPGKNGINGQKGDKGDAVQDAYFLTAVYNEGSGNWATWFDNIRNGVSGYSWVPGELGQKWAVNIGTNIQTDTPVTLEQPTMTPALKYLWKTSRAVTYNGNTPSYGEWSVPVLTSQTGPKGEDGKTVVTHQYLNGKVVRMSNWTDNQLEYANGETVVDGIYYLDVVKYVSGSTTSYYKCISNVTYTSSNKPSDPSTDSTHWKIFTPQTDSWFETMIANSAYVKDLTVDHLNTAGEDNSSLERIAISGNTMYVTDSIGNQKITFTGDTISSANTSIRYPMTSSSHIISFASPSTLTKTTRTTVISNIIVSSTSELQRGVLAFNVFPTDDYSLLPDTEWTANLILISKSDSTETVISTDSNNWGYVSDDSIPMTYTPRTLSIGTYDLVLEVNWNILDSQELYSDKEFYISLVPDKYYTFNLVNSQNGTFIGGNGLIVKLSDDFKAIFTVENNSPNILIQGKDSSNNTIGLKINATDGIKINNGDGWKNIATTS